jgi:hypothetical protein
VENARKIMLFAAQTNFIAVNRTPYVAKMVTATHNRTKFLLRSLPKKLRKRNQPCLSTTQMPSVHNTSKVSQSKMIGGLLAHGENLTELKLKKKEKTGVS